MDLKYKIPNTSTAQTVCSRDYDAHNKQDFQLLQPENKSREVNKCDNENISSTTTVSSWDDEMRKEIETLTIKSKNVVANW